MLDLLLKLLSGVELSSFLTIENSIVTSPCHRGPTEFGHERAPAANTPHAVHAADAAQATRSADTRAAAAARPNDSYADHPSDAALRATADGLCLSHPISLAARRVARAARRAPAIEE